jgi:hypothetical protein
MAIQRQVNFLPSMRVDVQHLRSVESAVQADFDSLAGKVLTGKQPLIVRGFTLSTANTVGQPASNLQLNVASGILMHFLASDAGTLYVAADNLAAETLASTNSKVSGSFSAGVINYIGLDLIRSADSTTSDLVQFLNTADTSQEIPETVPLARTLQYKIIISTQNFTSSSNVLPIAQVLTSATNTVVSITDCRKMMFRLGSGGDNPNAKAAYNWGNRTENSIVFSGGNDSFTGEDKSISSLKGWMDALTTSVWETRGGEYWYSPCNRDNVNILYGQPILSQSQDNWYFPLITVTATNVTRGGGNLVTVTYNNHPFVSGQIVDMTPGEANFPAGTKIITVTGANTFTYPETGSNVSNTVSLTYSSLMWKSLSIALENSTAISNTIADNAVTGVAVPDGYCVYVDVVRETNNATINGSVAALTSLGYSTIPGRRYIIAWRKGNNIFIRNRGFEVDRSGIVATTSILGSVKLNNTAGAPLAPVVLSVMSNGQAEIAATGGNSYGIKSTGATGTHAVYFSELLAGVYGIGGIDTGLQYAGAGAYFIGGSGNNVGGDGIQAIGQTGTNQNGNGGVFVGAGGALAASPGSGGYGVIAYPGTAQTTAIVCVGDLDINGKKILQHTGASITVTNGAANWTTGGQIRYWCDAMGMVHVENATDAAVKYTGAAPTTEQIITLPAGMRPGQLTVIAAAKNTGGAAIGSGGATVQFIYVGTDGKMYFPSAATNDLIWFTGTFRQVN